MKKFISSLVLSLSLFAPVTSLAAPYRSISFFDSAREVARGKSITTAVIDRSIEPEVRRVHTGIDPSGVGLKTYTDGYEKNMCVLERLHCRSARTASGKSVTECYQFTAKEIKCGDLR